MGDQTELLEARSHLERGLRWIHLSRASRSSREKAGGEEERERDPVTLMHAELYYALTRVRVKLAATVPPPGGHLSSSLRTSDCVCVCVFP